MIRAGEVVAGDIVGSARYHAVEPESTTPAIPVTPSAAARSLAVLERFVSILVVAGLALWLAPRLVEGPAGRLQRRPLASVGLGVLGLTGLIVLVPMLIVGRRC